MLLLKCFNFYMDAGYECANKEASSSIFTKQHHKCKMC